MPAPDPSDVAVQAPTQPPSGRAATQWSAGLLMGPASGFCSAPTVTTAMVMETSPDGSTNSPWLAPGTGPVVASRATTFHCLKKPVRLGHFQSQVTGVGAASPEDC